MAPKKRFWPSRAPPRRTAVRIEKTQRSFRALTGQSDRRARRVRGATCDARMSITMRQSGTPKLFNPEKACGFILPADGSSDIFMRFSVVEGSRWRRGAMVRRRQSRQARKGIGPKAVHLQIDR